MTSAEGLRVAAVIPCHNEATTIGKVVHDLRQAVAGIQVYVYDNASTDDTAAEAGCGGAIVRREERKGKGNVVRRAFADVEADVYVLIDGDDTYDATKAGELVAALLEGPYDHVVGVRCGDSATAFRKGHAVGNRVLNRIVSTVFGTPVSDMLSGYRVFSRRFVKSFPALAREFEIETELTIHALNLRVPQREVPVGFSDRPPGGRSKLRTYRDGMRILWWIMRLARYERPVAFHGVLAGLLILASFVLGGPVVLEYFDTGLVPRLPTALLASSLVILATLVFTVGVLLDALKRARDEASRLAYLCWTAPQADGR